MEHFGISCLEVLILFEQWAGHQLSDKVTRPQVRAHRPISISSVPVSEGSKFGRVVPLSVAWLERWVSFLVGQVGSFLARLVGTCLDSVIWAGTNVPMG